MCKQASKWGALSPSSTTVSNFLSCDAHAILNYHCNELKTPLISLSAKKMEATHTVFRSYTPSNFVLDWKSRENQQEQPATISPTNFTPKFRMDLLFPVLAGCQCNNANRILFSSIDDPELEPEAQPMPDSSSCCRRWEWGHIGETFYLLRQCFSICWNIFKVFA